MLTHQLSAGRGELVQASSLLHECERAHVVKLIPGLDEKRKPRCEQTALLLSR
jgi:hypothetical protein